MSDDSGEDYENLHPHDYEGQQQERTELFNSIGPIIAISHDLHYMKLRINHNGKEHPHRSLPIVSHFLTKYVNDLDMHDYLANVSYINRGGTGKHDETRDHLEIIRNNVNSMHGVVHYNLGKDHPVTQAMAKDVEKINHHINMFQWSSQMEED